MSKTWLGWLAAASLVGGAVVGCSSSSSSGGGWLMTSCVEIGTSRLEPLVPMAPLCDRRPDTGKVVSREAAGRVPLQTQLVASTR